MLLMSRRSLHSLVEEELSKTTERSSLVTEVSRRSQWLCIDDRCYEVNRERAERSTVGVFATWERAGRHI
jgi:hypothetical protein